MPLPVFSSAYFGSIPYFQAIIKAEQPIVIDVHERYHKQTPRNRTTILSANGPLHLSVPVKRINGNESHMEEVFIVGGKDWRKDHWKGLETAYENSPYFEHYAPDIHALIHTNHERLLDLNAATFQFIKGALDLPIELEKSTASPAFAGENDPRFFFNQKDFDWQYTHYFQVFSTTETFVPHLSILDILFNQGPMARNWIVPR